MKKPIIAMLAVSMLIGCATMGLTSRFRSEGTINAALLNGPVAHDFKNPKATADTLGRGKKMFMAGATVDARLLTSTGRKLDYLAEAQRTRESRATIEAAFARIDKENSSDICFVATLTHASINLAKASAWKMKASIDDGEWIELKSVGSDDIPNYSVTGGATEWFSAGVYCGEAEGWMVAKKSIRLNVFPPVFVNPGEAMLTWNVGRSAGL